MLTLKPCYIWSYLVISYWRWVPILNCHMHFNSFINTYWKYLNYYEYIYFVLSLALYYRWRVWVQFNPTPLRWGLVFCFFYTCDIADNPCLIFLLTINHLQMEMKCLEADELKVAIHVLTRWRLCFCPCQPYCVFGIYKLKK